MVISKEKVTVKVVDCDNVQSEQVHNFKYLGVTLSENGTSEEAARARMAAWLKWKELTNMIYDSCMPKKSKLKLYETLIRLVLLYGSGLWTV